MEASRHMLDDTMPTLSGDGVMPGNQITVLDNGVPIGMTTALPDGTWTCTPTTPLADGSHSLTVTETDSAGHTSAASAPQVITVVT